MRSLLETARATALAEGDLIRVALEHQMIENDRTLIAKMMESFRKQSWVERLVLLDRAGAERELHVPADQAGSSRVLETRPDEMLRTVIPIRNRAECYGCHDPGHKINGILILDYRTAELRQEMAHDLRWMVGGTAAITLLLVGAIGVVIRVAVLRRLQRFETAARQIAGGDLEKRVPVGRHRYDLLAGPRVQHHGRFGDRPGGRGAPPEGAAGNRDQQHRRRHRGARRAAARDRRQRRVSRTGASFARAGAGLPVPRTDSRRLHGGGLSDARLPRQRRAPGAALRAAHAGRKGGVGGGARLADPRFPEEPAAGGGSVARHFGPARRRGAPGRVAPAGVAGHAGFGLLARAEHAAGHRADVRGGHPAGDIGQRRRRARGSARARPSRASRSCAAAGSRSIFCGCRAGRRARARWSIWGR